MFSKFFGGKPRARRDDDRVFMSKAAKWRALLAEPDVKFVAHFKDTRREFQELARSAGRTVSVALAKELLAPAAPDPNLRVVVIERHPLREHDESLCEWADSAAARIGFNVSLDDALLAAFAGQLKSILERLGTDVNEALENAMLSRSIAAAQEKLRKQVAHEHPADSDDAWMRANVS